MISQPWTDLGDEEIQDVLLFRRNAWVTEGSCQYKLLLLMRTATSGRRGRCIEDPR